LTYWNWPTYANAMGTSLPGDGRCFAAKFAPSCPSRSLDPPRVGTADNGNGSTFATYSHVHRPILLFAMTACAGSANEAPSGPRGYRADQHLQMAARADARASELTHWPDTRPGADGSYPFNNPWFGTWDTVTEHRRIAAAHRSAAAQLEADYQDA